MASAGLVKHWSWSLRGYIPIFAAETQCAKRSTEKLRCCAYRGQIGNGNVVHGQRLLQNGNLGLQNLVLVLVVGLAFSETQDFSFQFPDVPLGSLSVGTANVSLKRSPPAELTVVLEEPALVAWWLLFWVDPFCRPQLAID
jgi:hypothetical protein